MKRSLALQQTSQCNQKRLHAQPWALIISLEVMESENRHHHSKKPKTKQITIL